MKVRPSVKAMCERCRVIKRHGRTLVICSNPAPQAAAGLSARMARIAGVNLPNQKRLEIGLTYIYRDRPAERAQDLRRARALARHEGARPDRGRGRQAARPHRPSTTRSRATSAASARRRSSACPRSAPTAACATAATCRCTASARRRTPAPARARRRPSAAARRRVTK